MADTITIEGVPARTWWRLATIAERRGIRVLDLLEEVSLAGVEPVPVKQARLVRAEEVRALHTQGLNDAEIARRLACTRSNVLYHRRKLDLPANATHGRQR